MTDPVNYHPHSRFSLHEKAGLFPFRDLIWNRTDGPFIDLKIDFPDPRNNYVDGTAYLRVEDVIEMARCLGMATREDVDNYKTRIKELEAQVTAIPTKVEEYTNGLAKLSSDFLADLSSPVSVDLAPVSESEVPEQTPSPEQPSLFESFEETDNGTDADSTSTSGPDEPAVESGNEPVVSERPDELSSAGSDEDTDPIRKLFRLER